MCKTVDLNGYKTADIEDFKRLIGVDVLIDVGGTAFIENRRNGCECLCFVDIEASIRQTSLHVVAISGEDEIERLYFISLDDPDDGRP